MDVTGTAIRYNREATTPAATFYDVGDTWTEATPTFTEVTTALKILGGDADVDNFLAATYANAQDIEAEIIASRAKAVAHKFSTAFIAGDSSVDTKSFDGIRKMIPLSQTLSMGVNGAALTLDKVDELIDQVKPGKPELLLMSKRTRRKLKWLWTQSPRADPALDRPRREARRYRGGLTGPDSSLSLAACYLRSYPR